MRAGRLPGMAASGCPQRGWSPPPALVLAISAVSCLPEAVGFKLIGAGYPKTGLASLDAALRQLGFNPYRMGHKDRLDHAGHHADLQKWLAILNSNSLELLDRFADELVVRGYDAILDVPMDVTEFTLRLVAKFPTAKVILTEHPDSEAWFNSYRIHMQDFKVNSARISPRPEVTMGTRIHALRRVHEAVCQKKFGLPEFPTEEDADRYIASYEQHNRDIVEKVPKDRLLEFDAHQGWTPLCSFLEIPEPQIQYPWLNSLDRDKRHLEWAQQYDFRFEVFFFGLIGLFVVTMAFHLHKQWRSAAKVFEEKSNV